MTAPYSLLHFLVDGICVYAMFGYFAAAENWQLNVLYYNFCAFALQMPLGVFVAPGAVGLFIGTQLGKSGGSFSWLPGTLVVAALSILWCLSGLRKEPDDDLKAEEWTLGENALLLAGGCLLVVILYSYIGMSVAIPWKSSLLAGAGAVAFGFGG